MDAIERWRKKGLLKDEQAALLADIDSGRLFSVSDELRALLYLGALLVIAGVGATVKRYIDQLGPLSIIAALSAAIVACFAYCEGRARPYSNGAVGSPTAAFDYLLFIGCSLIGVLFSYLEAKYHWLGDKWDLYLLASGLLFLCAAYRFDNRMALAMGLLNLGGCLGVRLGRLFTTDFQFMRAVAMAEGAAACAAGLLTARAGVKPHFRETYLGIGINVLFAALLSDGSRIDLVSPLLALILVLSGCCIAFATLERRFAYFVYGIGYGYIAVSIAVLRHTSGAQAASAYFLVSAAALILAIFRFRKSLEARE